MPLTFSFSDSQAGFVSIFVYVGGFWVVCVCVIYHQTDDDGVDVGFFFVDKLWPSFFNKRRG